MTYNPTVPQQTENPFSFVLQGQTNFTRLRTIINSDHQFNDATQANDGYHKIAHFVTQSGTFGDGTPAVIPATGQFYTKTVQGATHLLYKTGEVLTDQNKTWFMLSAGSCRAFVNFIGSGINGAQTIRANFNVSSVVRTAAGLYTVNFTEPMFNNNYCWSVSGFNLNDTNHMISGVQNNSASYGGAVTTTSILVRFGVNTGANSDPVGGASVMIFGG